MDDPILEGEEQESSQEAEERGEEKAATKGREAAEGARMDRLEEAMAQLTNMVRQTGQQLLSQPKGASKSAEEFLNELAADPEGVIRRVAGETVVSSTNEAITPGLHQVYDVANKQLMEGYRAKVDNEFGIGTFDEVFKPQLDKDISQLKQVNPRAIADPPTMEALVNRLYGGDNFDKLLDRRKVLETARTRGLSHLVPAGGVPRLKTLTGDELPNDVEQFLRDVEKSTGETINRKEYAKLYYTGVESGPGRHRTSVVDYLKAIGADPDTVRMYAGEKQA